MNRTIIPIRKMHCRSCELLIEKTLAKIPGIKRVKVSLPKAEAEILSNGTLDLELVRESIEKAGYEVGKSERRLFFTRDTNEYGYLAMSALVVLFLYFIVSQTGLLDFSIAISSGAGTIAAIFIGLTAGVSTCMALVGGLVLGMSVKHAEKHPEATAMEKFRPHLFFQLGRIIAFFVLGGLLGELGGFFAPSAVTLGVIMLIIAGVMLLLGLQLIDIFPALSAYKITLPSGISRMLGLSTHHEKEYSNRGAMTLGALTFFLPCGFTQLMQMNAIATGGFLQGGILMAAFALGTAPGLLGVGGLTSIVRGVAAKIFFKTAGILVIAFALFNFSSGYNLTGWDQFWKNWSMSHDQPVVISAPPTTEDGVQIVRMKETARGYEPNTFEIKKGVPVRWIIDAEEPNSCAASISVPSLSIMKYLDPGENIIEFTPAETGEIRFTCSMGMYSGKFIVVD